MRLSLSALLLSLPAVPVTLRAQATADQARLMFTVGVGLSSGGGTLWRVDNQPFITSGIPDTLAIARQFRQSLNVQFSGTYFPEEHLGFTVEGMLLGLGTIDSCNIVATLGSSETSDLCSSINHHERAATAAAVSLGLVYRLWSKQPVHPYAKVHGGLAITQQSFLKVRGSVIDPVQGPADLTLLEDVDADAVHPYLGLGVGVTAVVGPGYQFRFELRDNYVRLPAVAGPTARQNIEPGSRTVGKHLLSFSVGFDVVLERKRGRRY